MKRDFARAVVPLSVVVCLGAGFAQARDLTIDDRINAQEAIERVYWAHRIWPKENPQQKPSFEAVMPGWAVRAKVDDYLRKSNALETLWGRAITPGQLQAEIGRMVAGSRRPDVLGEIFDALHRDPFLVAECFARPILADRLLRNRYASDRCIHGKLRTRIESALARGEGQGERDASGGQYLELTWRLNKGEPELSGMADDPGAIVFHGRDREPSFAPGEAHGRLGRGRHDRLGRIEWDGRTPGSAAAVPSDQVFSFTFAQ